jgi:magnesium-transporting ATPase (P-type)
VALAEMSERVLVLPAMPPRCDEQPFDSERMRQSVIFPTEAGAVLYCKGALERVLPLCTSIHLAGAVRELDAATRDSILQAQDEMAAQGLRVIALAARPLPCLPREAQEQALGFCGLVGIVDPPREGVDKAIATCHGAGIKVIMVTGDHPRTALAIARADRPGPQRNRGGDLRRSVGRLSVAQLQLALDAPEIVFARVAADQKMRIVEALKSKGHIVAVTGDGVNDAPALRSAHIGIAMGLTGTDVAKEVADMVLLDDNFASIVVAIEEGRAVFQNIRKFITYVFTHNVAELVPSWPSPCSPYPCPSRPCRP